MNGDDRPLDCSDMNQMGDCPHCGALAVLFADYEHNDQDALGLRCARRCGWRETMGDLRRELIKTQKEATEEETWYECAKCETRFEDDGKDHPDGVLCSECRKRGYFAVGVCHKRTIKRRITQEQWDDLQNLLAQRDKLIEYLNARIESQSTHIRQACNSTAAMKRQIDPLKTKISRFKLTLRNIAAFNWPKPASVEISYENYPSHTRPGNWPRWPARPWARAKRRRIIWLKLRKETI